MVYTATNAPPHPIELPPESPLWPTQTNPCSFRVPSTRPGDRPELRRSTHRRAGGGAGHGDGGSVLGTQFLQGVLGGVSTLLGVLQLVLHLAVLGQVHGGDLLLQATKELKLGVVVPPALLGTDFG